MPSGRRSSRKASPSAASARVPLPDGPVPTSSGTVELVRDPSDPDAVTLLVNGVPSSHLDLSDPTWLEFEYMQHMAAVVDLLPPGPLDAVHLGAAACALPRRVEAVRPGSRQLAVDVDEELLRHVRTWFALPRSPRLRLRAGDGRTVLAGLPDASADVVVRDAFAGDATPAHLTTAEFVAQVHRVLRPGGVYLANCADRPPLALARAEVATTATALDVALVAEPGQLKGRRYGNLVVVGTREGGPDLAGPALARALRRLPVPATVLTGDALRSFVAGAAPRRDAPGPVPPHAHPA
ncbi:spermidine synthase [Actinotalea ferrariae CF5-4]|uniref:Spermidine synthase n=1 Tax=Actinotalea ferrariae CF5-4 TaxID=948458 RepID=A0A021VSM9_9CELL|nr:fused MFS/spermidine synthase [Actinotalea ferrariae]EYR64199.1 spermidine synthase [Actinotalea ferrariae CF5-4]